MTSPHTWILLAAVAVAVFGYGHAASVTTSKTDAAKNCGVFTFKCKIRKNTNKTLIFTRLRLGYREIDTKGIDNNNEKSQCLKVEEKIDGFTEILTIGLNSVDLSYNKTIHMKNGTYNHGRMNMSYKEISEIEHTFEFKIYNIDKGRDASLISKYCYQCALLSGDEDDTKAGKTTSSQLVGITIKTEDESKHTCRKPTGQKCYKFNETQDDKHHYIKETECFNCTCDGSIKNYKCGAINCPPCWQLGTTVRPDCCKVDECPPTTASTAKELETSPTRDDTTKEDSTDLTTIESTTTESTTTESDLPLPTWAIGTIVAGVIVLLIIAGFIMCCCFCGKPSRDGNAINITMSAPPPQILPATPSQVDNSDLKFRQSQMINPDIVRASMMMGSMMGSQMLNPSMLPQNMPQDNIRGSLMMGSQMMSPGMFPQDNFRGSQMMSPGQFSDFGSQQNRFSMSSRMGGMY